MKEIQTVSILAATDTKYQPTYLHHTQSTGNACQRLSYALPSGDTGSESGCKAESEKIP